MRAIAVLSGAQESLRGGECFCGDLEQVCAACIIDAPTSSKQIARYVVRVPSERAPGYSVRSLDGSIG